ncbi:MAG: DNA polymerase IV, partial [Candidatus Dormibacteraceae bacterium]
RCPELILVAPQPARYRTVSRQLHAIYRRFTSPDRIEMLGLDAAFLDITARTRRGTSSPEEIARRLKFMLSAELNLTASLGVATSKLVAQIAGSSRQPDGLVLVTPDSEADFLAPLPATSLPGLGPNTLRQLQGVGIRTLGELAGFETSRLVAMLGSAGGILQRWAEGRDRAPVEGRRPAQTISAEVTFERPTIERAEIDRTLKRLIIGLCQRLQADGVQARTAAIKTRLADSQLVTRQISRHQPSDDAELLFRLSTAALDRIRLTGRPVLLLGVGLSGLEYPKPDFQLPLFD